MKHFILLLLLSTISCKISENVTPAQVYKNNLIIADYPNVKIIENNAELIAACEPSIAINPVNPDNILAASVLDKFHYSFDGGKTWTTAVLQSDLGVYGDPCVIADSQGYFYYLHLSNPDNSAYASPNFLNQIVIHHSQNGGKSWDNGQGIGYNFPKQQDKEWAVCDPNTNTIYVTWTEFDKYGSKNSKDKSRIRFAKSTDGGTHFTQAVTISDTEGDALDDDTTTEGAVPAVDLEGNIYVAWALNNKIYFDKSFDAGKTWQKDIQIARQPGGWAQHIPGIGRCNGMPVTVVDVSNSDYSGTIYVNWTDQRNGNDNTDIFIIKSVDKGNTWSEPIRVNSDNTRSHQFFSWMTVDPVTGYIYIVYYDRSRYNNLNTDVVLAISKNGGKTFKNQIISKKPFKPSPGIFFGDYNNISAYNGVVRPVWTRYEDGKLSIWTALINRTD